jgi:3-phenylpropionate/trans-cinnamate dioxygenase ferredoxin reductase subunit
MISTILIIGGGQAGAQAVDTLRREGFGGRLVLICGEPELPYQRPPLSKKYLSGEMAADRLLFRHRAFYDEHRVELKLGRQAVRLDAAARRVELADGEHLTYDRLLLCLGAESRRLTCPGALLPGVHYLRALADSGRLHTWGARRHHRRRLHRARDGGDLPQDGLRSHRAGNGRPADESRGCAHRL